MHFVIMGCGRVGSTLAHTLEDHGHTVAIIDQDARRVPPARRRASTGRKVTGVGFDRDTLQRGRHRGGLRLRRGLQRRQLQHPRRPGGARDVRRRQRRGPHLRPGPRRDLPAPRHPHGRHGALDRRPDAAPAPARRRRAASSATPPARSVLAEVPRAPRLGRAPDHARSRRPPGVRVAFLTRFGEGHAARRRHRAPGGRPRPRACVHETASSEVDRHRSPRPPPRRSLMRVAIAGAGSVGRSIARELLEQRPRGPAHRPRRRRSIRRRRRAGRRVAARPTPARSRTLRGGRPRRLRRRRRRHRRRQGQPRRLAAGQDRVRRPPHRRAGSTTPRTSGCSTSPGASTSPCRRRGS